MKKIMISSAVAAIALVAAPASAQILGGGGGLGGAIGGGLGGSIGGAGQSIGDIGSRTTGSIERSGSTRIDRNVDRRSGRASADAGTSQSASGSIVSDSGALGQTLSGSAGGSGSASGSGGVEAQAIGTDAVRGVAQGAVGQARGIAGQAQGLAGGAASAGGSAAGNAQAMFQGSLGQLAASGSAAAQAAGSFAVAPGMIVEDARGRAIGEVTSLRSTANGTVSSVVMAVGDRQVALPADNFSASGEGLVSAMGRGAVRSEARRQDDAND